MLPGLQSSGDMVSTLHRISLALPPSMSVAPLNSSSSSSSSPSLEGKPRRLHGLSKEALAEGLQIMSKEAAACKTRKRKKLRTAATVVSSPWSTEGKTSYEP
jgi:hypothetical protein